LFANCTEKFRSEDLQKQADLSDLVVKLLETDPGARLSSIEAISHAFFQRT